MNCVQLTTNIFKHIKKLTTIDKRIPDEISTDESNLLKNELFHEQYLL